MAITYYVVLSFGRDEEATSCRWSLWRPSGDAARRRAQAVAGTHAGAVAISRTGASDSGEFSDAVILGTFGAIDRNMLGE